MSADKSWVRDAVPVCLGDNYEGKRVVGTTSGMFDLKDYKDRPIFQFAEGQAFDDGEKGWFTAVAGATAARQTGLKLGGKFRPTHDAGGGRPKHKHGEFTVVGILKATGSPNDNVLFVNIEGFYRVGGHAGRAGMALMEEKPSDAATGAAKHEPKPADEPRDMSQPRSNSDAAASAKPPEGGTPAAKTDEDHDEDEHLHRRFRTVRSRSAPCSSVSATRTETNRHILPTRSTRAKVAHGPAVVPAKEIDELIRQHRRQHRDRIAGVCDHDRTRGRHRHHGEHLQLDERPPARNRHHACPGCAAEHGDGGDPAGIDLALARRRSARPGYGPWSVGRCRAVDRRAGELAA